MASDRYRFDPFLLDPIDRRLTRNGTTVELNARYLDALILLVREQGKLVSKDRFLDEVWRGVPVTDEALTQCIKTLRRQLGDDATRPRLIETVPKHGYRFIATVNADEPLAAAPATVAASAPPSPWRRFFLLGEAGAIGGVLAGVVGGLFYALGGAAQALPDGMSAGSIVMALVSITALVGLLGGAGVSFGVAAAGFASQRAWLWNIVGGAGGGLVVGAVVKLLGLDAFNLLFGGSPDAITGAPEGALLGGAVGLGTWLAGGGVWSLSRRHGVALAGLAGGSAGVLIALLGGRLMGGSLDLLARHFPQSRLSLDPIGRLFGEDGYGSVTLIVTTGLEGALFAVCVAGAMVLARDGLIRRPTSPD